ncbi:MAG: MotA/TolQ/ExbB proton channel family protein, partial [Gammaproteobacteria bacterium]
MEGMGLIDLVAQGGLLMGPIIICSIVAAAIVGERFWSLRRQKIIPPQLTVTVWKWIKNNQMDAVKLKEIKAGSPLGR